MKTEPTTPPDGRNPAASTRLCGCGRPIQYELRGKWSCNKYTVCPTYEELREQAAHLHSLVLAYRAKRQVDGLNGRTWDAAKHYRAEATIEELETPQDFFDRMNALHGPLELDVCASPTNAKCPRYYTRDDDGLAQPWNGKCWRL